MKRFKTTISRVMMGVVMLGTISTQALSKSSVIRVADCNCSSAEWNGGRYVWLQHNNLSGCYHQYCDDGAMCKQRTVIDIGEDDNGDPFEFETGDVINGIAYEVLVDPSFCEAKP